ncbi:MAG: hypothetical protein V2I33_05670, partial [Kangiellaceae bacterium]|nr:hypothetical protein [Kangiellaceae bacterium]
MRGMLLLLLVFLSNLSFACSCMQKDLIRSVNNSDHIFIAEVTSVEIIEKATNDRRGTSGKRRAYFDVKQVFKGNPYQIPYIRSADTSIGAACEAAVSRGTYNVFASGEGP